MEGTTFYALIRLSREIIVDDDNGNQTSRQLVGCYGFLPVYETFEEAMANSNNGEFQIVTLVVGALPEMETEAQEEQSNPDSDEIQVFE